LAKSAIPSRILAKILSVFFHQLYHQFAWSYDFIANLVSLGRWQQWVTTTLPYLGETPVLELGHGPGHLQKALQTIGVESYGLDESKQMGRLAKRRLMRVDCKLLLVNGYAQFMPFPNNVFARIVATFPSEYIYNPDTIAEIRRVLQPGGVLVLVPLAWITGAAWYDRLAAWLFRATYQAPPLSENNLVEQLRRPFTEQHLKVEHNLIDLGASQVLLILAEKPVE